MNIPRHYFALVFALVCMLVVPSRLMNVSAQGAGGNAPATPEQQSMGALQRGYRTGYSDGYQAGWRDVVERAANDYRGKEDYRRGDRAHAAGYGRQLWRGAARISRRVAAQPLMTTASAVAGRPTAALMIKRRAQAAGDGQRRRQRLTRPTSAPASAPASFRETP